MICPRRRELFNRGEYIIGLARLLWAVFKRTGKMMLVRKPHARIRRYKGYTVWKLPKVAESLDVKVQEYCTSSTAGNGL